MNKAVLSLIQFIESQDGAANKSALIRRVRDEFRLTKDRSVYYCPHYAIRFSSTKSGSFSNTVIALSTILISRQSYRWPSEQGILAENTQYLVVSSVK